MNNSVLDVMVRSVAIAAFLETPRDVEIIVPAPQATRPAKPSWLALAWSRLGTALRRAGRSRKAGERLCQGDRPLTPVPSRYRRVAA